MKKLLFLIILIIIGGYLFLHGCPDVSEITDRWGSEQTEGTEETEDAEEQQSDEEEGSDEDASSASDFNLRDVDGGGWNYAFTYKGEDFRVIYQYDCWTIYDSYKITSKRAQKRICQALIDIHPVHGRDMESYRTAEDMAYEWQQHNIAYKYLPEDNAWRLHAANVDLDPQDQGRTIEEIYEDRTGQEIDLKEKVTEKVKESIEDGTIFEKIEHYVFN